MNVGTRFLHKCEFIQTPSRFIRGPEEPAQATTLQRIASSNSKAAHTAPLPFLLWTFPTQFSLIQMHKAIMFPNVFLLRWNRFDSVPALSAIKVTRQAIKIRQAKVVENSRFRVKSTFALLSHRCRLSFSASCGFLVIMCDCQHFVHIMNIPSHSCAWLGRAY